MTLRKLLAGFNLSLLLTLILSIALPLLLLGYSALDYFRNNITGIGIMLVSFIAINIYFAYNWSLFNFLEKGDWYSLQVLLRRKIFEQKHYSRQNIFYFIEVAIQLNNLSLLSELHEELRLCSTVLQKFSLRRRIGGKLWAMTIQRHFRRDRCYKEQGKEIRLARQAEKRLCDFAIEFGLPHLVEEPGQESERYFGDLREFAAFQQQRYQHSSKWAELFYAIALLVQGKCHYAADILEQLLLNEELLSNGLSQRERLGKAATDQQIAGADRRIQRADSDEAADKTESVRPERQSRRKLSFRSILQRIRKLRSLRKNALLQLVSIQLLEDLQSNLAEAKRQSSQARLSEESLQIDEQLIALRRTEIQKLYDSPKHWSAHLLKEQSQNIAIAMIRQLINAAYDKQLRPTHQAYMAALESRSKVSKQRLEDQHNSLHR